MATKYDGTQREWPAPTITHDRKAGVMRLSRLLPDDLGIIQMTAKKIRQSKYSGRIEADIFIGLSGDYVAQDNLSVMKGDDRTKLSNKAHKSLGDVMKEAYPAYVMQRDLDLFCFKVDDALEEAIEAEELEGKEWTNRFLLEPYVSAGSGTILFAPPGSAKSYLALLKAVSIDAGVSKIWPVTKAKVLFVNLERSRESFAGRLLRVNRVLGLPDNRPLLMLNERGSTLEKVARAAEYTVNRYKVDVVVLDSISRSGGDLNDNVAANAVMDVLNSFGGGWLAVGHPPRADSARVFGSQMFDAAADLTIQVLNQKNGMTTGVGLKMRKFNDIPPRPVMNLALDFDSGGLVSVRQPHTAEFLELDADTEKLTVAKAITGILPIGSSMTIKEICTALSDDGYTTTYDAVGSTLRQNTGIFVEKKEARGKGSLTGIWSLRERY